MFPHGDSAYTGEAHDEASEKLEKRGFIPVRRSAMKPSKACDNAKSSEPSQKRSPSRLTTTSLVLGVEVLIENFVHGEHVNTVLFEDGAHGVVASYLALVAGVL
jgi:hypothetical protein